jgi:hypothetical protein
MKTLAEIRAQINEMAYALNNIAGPSSRAQIPEIEAVIADLTALESALVGARCGLRSDILTRLEAARSENAGLIAVAAARDLAIGREIYRKRRDLEVKVQSYDLRLRELREARVPVDKLDIILPPITDTEKAEAVAKIAALEAEQRAIQAFLRSGPKYDLDLLRGTTLESMALAEAA